jgi:hypothetical protein
LFRNPAPHARHREQLPNIPIPGLKDERFGHQNTHLARIPAKWNHFAEKDSRQINTLEQILIAKVFNFGGICSKAPLQAGGRIRYNSRPEDLKVN